MAMWKILIFEFLSSQDNVLHSFTEKNQHIMARNSDWKNDEKLQRELTSYIAQNLKRVEILDYMKRGFGEYETEFVHSC